MKLRSPEPSVGGELPAKRAIEELRLVPSDGGVFEVVKNGKPIFSSVRFSRMARSPDPAGKPRARAGDPPMSCAATHDIPEPYRE
ncbi:MAG: hypothetical protein H6700_12410 [Myxococcales bacterium]|nr:hypothetical protein [Myxococcales bacterium]